MAQAYSDPKRAGDPHALPDVEVFYGWVPHEDGDCPNTVRGDGKCSAESCRAELLGWYWQSCFPGCLPDGEPNGPFETEAEALADAQSEADSVDGAADGGDCIDCDGPCWGHDGKDLPVDEGEVKL